MGQEAAIQSAWAAVQGRAREDVCRCAPAGFDESTGTYMVKCFGHDVAVCPVGRGLSSASPAVANLFTRYRYFFELSVLWYLATAKDSPPSGKLIRPTDLKTGNIFAVGSHVLPLERLAAIYGENLAGFVAKGQTFNGQKAGIGDASFVFYPFPRVPVTLVLWKGDDEFKARADLLFDSTCELHMPQDIVWAAAMFSTLIMM